MNTAEPNAQSRSSRLGHPRDQPLALGLFSTNINGSTIMTTAPTSFELSWEHSKLIATMADRMGLDFLVSVARRSEEHTSELQSLMRISYAVFCLQKKKTIIH